MYILLVIGVVLVLLLSWRIYHMYSEISYYKSDIDQRVYMIRRGQNKTPKFLKESANTLAKINDRILKLIDILVNKYSQDPTKNYFIQKLKDRYSPYMISEAAVDPRYTTYTVDKNEIHMCLRTRDAQEKIYDIDLLIYVNLHELAHLCNFTPIGTPIQGHGTEFKRIFKFLVQEALDAGLYKYTDYSQTPVNYCNLIISSNIL